MKNVFENLIFWAEERLITTQPHDKNGYLVNLVSELAEFAEAMNSSYSDNLIDALCDIVVFTVTEMPKVGVSRETIIECHETALNKIHIRVDNFERSMLLKINDIIEERGSLSVNMFEIISMCYDEIDTLGYDINKAMEQTFLEIDSRKGLWNEDAKKWKKFTDDYHKSLWVKADYTKALK